MDGSNGVNHEVKLSRRHDEHLAADLTRIRDPNGDGRDCIELRVDRRACIPDIGCIAVHQVHWSPSTTAAYRIRQVRPCSRYNAHTM